jgi:hypothetical protein
MLRFIGGDIGVMLQRESNFVQSFQQAVAGELVDLECSRESVRVVNRALLEIDRDLVAGKFCCSASDLTDLVFTQHHG